MLTKEKFIQLSQQYMDDIFRFAFSCVKSKADADDVTQIVLLRLYETDKTFESDCHLKNWLIRVTLNECRKYWRSPWRRTEDFTEYASSIPFESSGHSDVFDTVMSLDQKYRVVIFLYYYEGYAVKEIANLLKIPQGTVGIRLKRAKEQLRKILSEEAYL